MQKNLRFYLDFTADLNRVINCLVHNNDESANVFFVHAIKIYKEKLNPEIDRNFFPRELQNHWNRITAQKLPKNKKDRLLVADKILTISTILFNRTYHHAFN